MLHVFRRYSGGIVAKLILILLIISFAAWGIADMLRTHGMQTEVARVGKVRFTTMNVQREMQKDIQQIRDRLGKNYNPALLKQLGLAEQVVGRMVGQEMINQEINDLQIRVGDSLVAELIRQNPTFAGKDNKFSKTLFLSTLKQHGLNEKDYIDSIKNEMASRLLSQAVSASATVPDIAVNVLLAAEKEKRAVELYTIDTADIKVPEPTDKELEEYYKSVSARYTIPEFRTVRYVTLDVSNVDDVKVTEEELQHAYEERKGEYSTSETRSFEQLLYADQSDAEKAYARLKEGKNIAAVAKEVAPMNKGNTAIKNVSGNTLPEEIRETAFQLAKDEVSAPIKSSFGYHVLKLTEIKAAHTKPFEEVRSQLENELRPDKLNDALTQKSHALEDMLAGGSTLQEAAKKMGLTIKTFGPFSKSGRSPDGAMLTVPSLNNFAVLAFSTDEGTDSNVTMGQPGTFYLLHVDKVQPEKLPALASVKNELIKTWKATRKNTLELAQAEEVAAKLADPKERGEMLKSPKLTRITGGTISRVDTKLGGKDLSAMLVQDIFNRRVGDVTNAFPLPAGGYAVALINDVTMPPLLSREALAESSDAAKLRSSIRTNMQQELMSQYMDSMADKFEVKIHKDVLSSMSMEE